MSGWHLRLARPDDAALFPAIERAAGSLFAGRPELGSFDRTETRTPGQFRRLILKGHSLVAYVDEAMVGFLVTEPFARELHLWEVSVLPQFQQRGIGAGLVLACMIDARNASFGAVTLTTFRDVAWNAPFYQRLGFVEATNHARLDARLADEVRHGFAKGSRCAMIHSLR